VLVERPADLLQHASCLFELFDDGCACRLTHRRSAGLRKPVVNSFLAVAVTALGGCRV
jgi:hypothetical protein